MKLLIMAMLLSVVQVPAPAPPKAANNTTRSSQQKAKNAESDKAPAAPAPAQTAPRPDSEQVDGGGKPSNEQQHTVAVSKLPPVSVSRNGWDWFYLVLTALLVLIGGVTVAAIWYQARETRKAAEAARESADAARKSAEAMEKSVRLQQAQLEQWIDTTDDWDVDGGYLSNKIVSSAALTISFGVVNPTKMLLTLRSVVVSVSGEQVVSRSPGSVLSPEGTPYMLEFKKG